MIEKVILERIKLGVQMARERTKDSGAVIGEPILLSVEIKPNEN